ncbi:MAG: hypothetical protein EON58_16625 [Alphaproteobacteria bacterium]|nr:MAG: hypothetical protein EON58_16625 [Alphaproteobacteria bacterium]
MQTLERSESRARRGLPIATAMAVGALAGIWQFVETREPGYLMAAVGFVLTIPRAWLTPIIWRDPMDMTSTSAARSDVWNNLHRIGFVLILCGIVWASRA